MVTKKPFLDIVDSGNKHKVTDSEVTTFAILTDRYVHCYKCFKSEKKLLAVCLAINFVAYKTYEGYLSKTFLMCVINSSQTSSIRTFAEIMNFHIDFDTREMYIF